MLVQKNKDTKILVFETYKYLMGIADGKISNIEPYESSNKLVLRLVEITGWSRSLLHEVIKRAEVTDEDNLDELFTRRATKNVKKTKTNLNHEELNQIREIIYNFHKTEGRLVTLNGLCKKVENDMQVKLSVFSMKKVIKKLGFRFIRTKNNRLKLIEKDDIVLKRIKYLSDILHFRKTGRPIKFVDETYVHTYYSTVKAWQDDSTEGFMPKIGKGQRFIVGMLEI